MSKKNIPLPSNGASHHDEGGPSNRNRTSTSTSNAPHTSQFKKLLKPIVKNYINPLLVIIVIGTLIPFVLILIRAALRPGPLYCDEYSCPPGLEAIISDTAMLIIGLLLYAFFASLCILILLSSGSWMHRAFRNKVIVISALYSMFWSIIQLSAPAAHRMYIIPYHVANPMYFFTINQTSTTSASFDVTDFYSTFYEGKNIRVAVQVYEVPNSDVTPHTIDPWYDMIYSDNWGATTTVAPDVFIQRNVHNLENNNYYLWTVIPAQNGAGGAYPSTDFLFPIDVGDPMWVDIYNGTLVDTRTSVDVRGYVVCKWEETTGCL